MEKIGNKKYNKLLRVGKTFNNYTFTDCTFESVDFSQCTFVNCTFDNCTFDYTSRITASSFINCIFKDGCLGAIDTSKLTSCSFFSCDTNGLYGNYLFDCEFNDVHFEGNSAVYENTFDSVRGSMVMCSCHGGSWGAYNNTFKNMDFSGFVGFYKNQACIALVKNSFINVTISTDAIMQLARETNCFGFNDFRGGRNISPKTAIAICLNMSNLSNEEKVGLIANAFLRLPEVDEDVLFFDPEVSPKLETKLHLSFVDNDMAPIIVGEDGQELDPNAIPIPDIQINLCRQMTNSDCTFAIVDAECGEYGIGTNEEPSKHYIKKYIKLS